MKLKYREIKPLREQLQREQNNLCSLCAEPISEQRPAVLDHDHQTGLIRGVLHRGCNALLGKLENNLARNQLPKQDLETWLANCWRYISTEHTDLQHPTYKTKTKTTQKKKKPRSKQNVKQIQTSRRK